VRQTATMMVSTIIPMTKHKMVCVYLNLPKPTILTPSIDTQRLTETRMVPRIITMTLKKTGEKKQRLAETRMVPRIITMTHTKRPTCDCGTLSP
jgi:hypothetical protein